MSLPWDLIAARPGGHIIEIVRGVADLVVIRIVLELEIRQPDISPRVSSGRRLILLLRIAGDALER